MVASCSTPAGRELAKGQPTVGAHLVLGRRPHQSMGRQLDRQGLEITCSPARTSGSRRWPGLLPRFYDPGEGADPPRSGRPQRLPARRPAQAVRHRPPGAGPLLDEHLREHRLRPPRGERGPDHRRRRRGRRPQVHLAAPPRVRDLGRTHRPSALGVCDMVLEVKDGRLVAPTSQEGAMR
jgi:hypothetical protein